MPQMVRIKWSILFFVFPLLILSQAKTPLVSYDFESDAWYTGELRLLKNMVNRESIDIIKSIAELSYDYKDWDTAIDYFEKLLVDSPTAENYFKLGVAAARKSLEVSRFFSVPYILKAKNSVLQAHELKPKKVIFLNLLIQLYAEIPSLFGGSIVLAETKTYELQEIDPVEGKMMQAYVLEVKNNYEASKSKYAEVFRYIKEEIPMSEQWGSKLRRDLIFRLGRAAAEFQIEPELGIAFLNHYLKSYGFKDNYPMEWIYFYRSKIYLYSEDFNKSKASIQEALQVNPNFEEGLEFLKTIKLE